MARVITDNYNAVLEDLRGKVAGDRATLRLSRRDADYPVAGEALAPGVPSIWSVTSLPQRDAETTSLIRREGRTLAIRDVMSTRPRPPKDMITMYGLRSFMMAPLAKDEAGELEGWVSVHCNSPRDWTEIERKAIEVAADVAQRSVALQRCMNDLLDDLKASRCTLRQNVPGDYDYPVTHEAVASGVMSIKHYRNLPQLGSPTFERIGRTRRVVVQNDCWAAASGADAEYSTEYQQKLNSDYGNMSAFIAAPVYIEDQMHGVISVHMTENPRIWADADIKRVEDAVQTVKITVS